MGSLVQRFWLTRFLLPYLLLFAAQVNASQLFDDTAVIDVELVGPVGSLIKSKDDKSELPFVLTANGIDHELQVRARGKSRLRVCSFPMLRLNFPSRQAQSGDALSQQGDCAG